MAGASKDTSIGSPASNDLVRANLEKHGDDGTVPRAVEHFGYPDLKNPACKSEQDVSKEFEQLGYAIRVLTTEDGSKEWHEFSNVSEVASGDFDAVTADFVKRLRANGWVYDGWSCSVLQATSQVRKDQ